MGFWYLLILTIGIFFLIKSTFFNKNKIIVILSIGLILFALFMFSSFSTKLIDLLF